MKSTSKTAIGQIVFTAHLISRERKVWELQTTWVQRESLQELKQCRPDYTDPQFPTATVEPGDPNTTGHQSVKFNGDPSLPFILEDGKTYAALAGWEHPFDQPPFMIGVCSIEDFRKAETAYRRLVESIAFATRNTHTTPPTKATTRPTKKFFASDVEVKIPDGIFFAETEEEWPITGTIQEIFTQLSVRLRADPTQALKRESTVWKKKTGMRWETLSQAPNLPAPNTMLMTSLTRNKATSPSERVHTDPFKEIDQKFGYIFKSSSTEGDATEAA